MSGAFPERPPAEPRAGPVRVAVLCGTDSTPTVAWERHAPIEISGNNDAWRLIDPEAIFWRRFHLAPSYFAARARWSFERYDVILNIISDPDRNPRTLAVAQRIVERLSQPVIDPPAAIRGTTRDAVARRLAGIPGLVVPRTLRLRAADRRALRPLLDAAGFRFPAILRVAGTQTGDTVQLFQGPAEVGPALEARGADHILTEFVDFASADRLYRKIRYIYIGEEVIIRHMLTADVWSIHGADRARVMDGNELLEAEERAFIRAGVDGLPPLQQGVIREVRARLGLDYFGMDCGILPSGEMVLFEANATMNFLGAGGKLPDAFKREMCLAPARAAMTRLLRARVAAAAA